MDWGTAGRPGGQRLLLLGSGELGKEVAIEAQRLGIEVVAVDRYAGAPAMQVAHRSHVIDMTDPAQVRRVVEAEDPDWVVPEIEAIATRELEALESEGFHVVPTARAARLTMDREGIRRLAAEELGLPTSPYRFAGSLDECRAAAQAVGLPCVVKPTMSSSGKGQSVARTMADVDRSWAYASEAARTRTNRVIVEGFVHFDYEITLLTVRHRDGTSFCPPIGHVQVDGDYRESWQPHPMPPATLRKAEEVARQVTDALGGRGVFGVELFVRGEEVVFSEVSPRPHDTGLVTLASQDLSEFALHVRAVTGLPVPEVRLLGPAASAVVLADATTDAPAFAGVAQALREPGTHLRLFGKPAAHPRRRMGVVLARGDDVEAARRTATAAAAHVRVVPAQALHPPGAGAPGGGLATRLAPA